MGQEAMTFYALPIGLKRCLFSLYLENKWAKIDLLVLTRAASHSFQKDSTIRSDPWYRFIRTFHNYVFTFNSYILPHSAVKYVLVFSSLTKTWSSWDQKSGNRLGTLSPTSLDILCRKGSIQWMGKVTVLDKLRCSSGWILMSSELAAWWRRVCKTARSSNRGRLSSAKMHVAQLPWACAKLLTRPW